MTDTRTWPCEWLVEATPPAYDPARAAADPYYAEMYDEMRAEWGMDGPVLVDCGAQAQATPDGWRCAAGHEHVSAQARYEQGWDYAEDDQEARSLLRAGVEPRDMQGRRML